VTFHWSGAGVVFSAPDAASTDASFAATGTYPITVTATSGALQLSATANVTVNPAATGPVVDPGPTQTITLPVDSVTLAGSVIDPGLRPGQALTIVWTETSGPAAVAFDTPASPVTVARFVAPGAYVLRLTANDGAFLAFAETAVIVNPAAPNGTGPVVDAGPSISITLPQNTATLQGSVSEAVLPPGAALTQSWRQVSGPATVSFTSPNSAVTAARFPLAGVYVVRLSATDGIFLNSDDTVVTVLPQPPSLVVNAGPDQTLAAGARTAALSGSISPVRATTQSAWTFVAGPSPVRFSDPRQPGTTVSFDLPGIYTLRLTAVDGASTAFSETHLTVPASAAPGCTPAVALDPALDGTRVTSAVNVAGSVSCGDWLLRAALDGDGQNPAWRAVGAGSGAATGVLASFDPTQLVNGTWTLQLLATGDGGTFATSIAVTVDRNQKVGNFAISFSDLTLSTPGMPLAITRSYDSKDPRSGDFGNGWQLSIGNVRVEKSAPLGKFWEETASSGFFPTYCLRPTRPETVTITFPSGKVYRFDAGASPACSLLFPIEFADVVFTPAEGTVGSLTPDDTSVIVSVSALPGDATLISSGTFDVYNPVNFALTVEDGTTYFVRQGGQVQQIVDPGGNSITLQGNGIIASSGASTLFTRDAAGRITSITDPNGGVLRYAYDAAGNLVSFTDRSGAVTTYGYDGDGRMTRLTDPRGVDLLSNGWGPDGRLASTTDAAGQSISYSYDPANNRETVRDRAGNVTTFDYDADGNVVRTVDALGNVTTATFDARDDKLSETDPLGHTRHWTYDAQGNQTSRTDALGNVTRYTYGPLRDLLTTTDALGRVTTEEHEDTPVCGRSPSGLFLGITNALGERTHQVYTADPAQGCVRLIDQIVDARGGVTRYTYDSAQRIASSTDALGAVATFTYDANGNLLTRTQKRTRSDGTVESLVTRYELDANGRRTAVILPDGSTTRTVYDPLGKAVETIDAMGRHTKMAYDDLGRLTSTTYPDGTVASTTYTPNGRPATQTDRGGRTTRFEYDALDRPIRVTAPDGSVRTTEYDAAGHVLAQVDELGRRTTFTYDAAGRRASMTDALGRTTAYAYDAVGNLVATTDPLGHTVTTVYDALNRASSVVYPDGTQSRTTYDAGGNRASTIDQAGFATSFAYDLAGRLATVTDARFGVTSYQYDEIGERVAQTDADGHTTRFTFDPAGRRDSRTLPGGETERMTYAADGRLQTRTDFNGHSTAYAYDDAGRLALRSPDAAFAGETPVSFTYFPSGQRKTMTDGSGTTSYVWDARDRLLSKASPAGTLSYGYDLAGNRTSAASDSGAYSVTYAYDALNRLTSVTDHAAGGGTTTYAWDEAGRLTGEAYPNGVSSALGYDANGRLTSESLALGGPAPRLLASYAYTRQPTGAPSSVAELSGRSVQWSYDELWRLTSESISAAPVAGTVGYTYDPIGNRLTRSSTVPGIAGQTNAYDDDDRLLADGYDANGNTISDGGRAIRYDSQDRMIALPGVVSYGYDGDGQLVSRTAGGATVSYLVDALTPAGETQIVEERQGGAVQRSFVYGLRRIALHAASGTRYYGYDAHSGVRLLTDEAGQVTDTWDYDAFGAVIGRTGATDNPFTYRGEQFDPLTGLQYLRARWMDPAKGRFWTRDTFEGRVEQPLSRHAYLYAHASPVLGRDHSGHEFDEESMLVAADISAELDTMASANYSALLEAFEAGDGAAVGQAFNTFGAIAEEGADAVIESALGDSVVVDSEVTFGQIGQGASRLDRVLQSADGLRKMILEVKYSFPQKGPALTRLLNQIANASAAGEGKVVVWALTESSEAAVVEALGPAAENVTFLNGVSELWIEISEFFGVL
jgi:RHS repeat-associated protein